MFEKKKKQVLGKTVNFLSMSAAYNTVANRSRNIIKPYKGFLSDGSNEPKWHLCLIVKNKSKKKKKENETLKIFCFCGGISEMGGKLCLSHHILKRIRFC